MNLSNENSNVYVINFLKLYLEIIAIMLTSSLSVFNCFISKKRDKMFILWNQNNEMKSKGADEEEEKEDAFSGEL